MTHENGYRAVQELLRYGADLAYGLTDQELGHGLLDLSRAARREIAAIGLKGGADKVPRNSYEGALLTRVMPEIARRLIEPSGARLLLVGDERPDADVTGVPDGMLRREAAECLAKSAFGLIAEKVRDRFDPDYARHSTFYATEAIQRDPRAGNIIEISLSRAAPPSPDSTDNLAETLSDWSETALGHRDQRSWTPELPMPDGDDVTHPSREPEIHGDFTIE